MHASKPQKPSWCIHGISIMMKQLWIFRWTHTIKPNGQDPSLYKGIILTSSTLKSTFPCKFNPFPEISFPSYKFHFELLLWGPSEPLLVNFLNVESAMRSPRSMESLVTLPVSDILSKSAWPIWCFSISSRKTPFTGLWTFRFGSYVYPNNK